MRYFEINKTIFHTIGIEIFCEKNAKFLCISLYKYCIYIGRNIGSDGMNRGRIWRWIKMLKIISTQKANKVCPSCKEFDGKFCKRNHFRVDQLMIVDGCPQSMEINYETEI